MERREFLKRAGLIAGAATVGGSLLAACSGTSPTPGFDSIVNHSPQDSGIDTVVIVMMENRSFDHYFGWLGSDAEYLETGRRLYGKSFTASSTTGARRRSPTSGRARSTTTTSARAGSASPRWWPHRSPRRTRWTTRSTTTPRSCGSSSGGSSVRRPKAARAGTDIGGGSRNGIATRRTSDGCSGSGNRTPTSASTSTCR